MSDESRIHRVGLSRGGMPRVPRGKPLDIAAGPFLRPAVVCPRCTDYPTLRITEAEVLVHRDTAPDSLVQSYQCQNCRTIYMIPAEAFQQARAA